MTLPTLLLADAPIPGAAELAAALQKAHVGGPDTVTKVAEDRGLHAMSGARNNRVYRWVTADGDTQCVKLYKADDERRLEREWNALTLLAQQDVPGVPRALWCVEDPELPIMGMTMVPGTPTAELDDPLPALAALPALANRIHAAPLVPAFRRLPRVDNAEHYVERIHRIWPEQMHRKPDDECVGQMRELLGWWRRSDDAAIVTEWAPSTFSRGDANLLNWLWDGKRLSVVDFEFAGYSDPAFDAADLVEHISARPIPDTVWDGIVEQLGVTNRRRYRAARRTCALRWLAVLWKHREKRPDDFQQQLARVLHLRDTLR